VTDRQANQAEAPSGQSSRNESSTGTWMLVFDLDGTLINSTIDLCNSVNAALRFVGKGPLPQDAVARFVGDGAAMLVRRALHASDSHRPLPEDAAGRERMFEEAFAFFLRHYREHKLDNTFVYPGVLEALEQIRSRHSTLPMAVLTNKPVNPSREICAALGLSPYFFANYGGNSFGTKKPDPEGLLTLMSEARVLLGNPDVEQTPPEGVIMIGDSGVDVLTARAAGARCLGCSYGLSPEALVAAEPDWIVDSATEWLGVLDFETRL